MKNTDIFKIRDSLYNNNVENLHRVQDSLYNNSDILLSHDIHAKISNNLQSGIMWDFNCTVTAPSYIKGDY